jgi:hypothetical protein
MRASFLPEIYLYHLDRFLTPLELRSKLTIFDCSSDLDSYAHLCVARLRASGLRLASHPTRDDSQLSCASVSRPPGAKPKGVATVVEVTEARVVEVVEEQVVEVVVEEVVELVVEQVMEVVVDLVVEEAMEVAEERWW